MRDEEWFAAVYGEHYPAIVRYLRRRLPDGSVIEETAQEVFVVAWRRRSDVPDHALPWLYGVARRLLANTRRARRSAPALVQLDDDRRQTGTDDAHETLLDVRNALHALSHGDQEILRLVGWERLTLAEAAVTLGCSRATAKVRLHRARRRLRAVLHRGPPRQLDASTAVPAPVRH